MGCHCVVDAYQVGFDFASDEMPCPDRHVYTCSALDLMATSMAPTDTNITAMVNLNRNNG